MGRTLLHALVIEDDLATSRFICEGLEEAGFRALGCYNGHAGLAHIESAKWDVIVLDRMLPGQLDGMRLLKTMREQGDQTPVIVVSAINSTEERILGLRSGGDDYLPKPFALGELLARIESVLRRVPAPGDTTVLRVADLVLDVRTMRASRAGQAIHLQVREFRLLEYLMRHEGQVITRAMLLEKVWHYHFNPQSNITDVQISRLRNKIDRGFLPALIHTVRGVGYCLSAEPADQIHATDAHEPDDGLV
jgi:two-component system OmpR family response regulator